DIMDKAPLRRNKATVHERWNNDIAILSGDTMFVKSYQLMMHVEDSKLREVLDIFCKTAVEVCEGQQYDMNFESLDKVSIDEYLHMITLKTAVLLAASLQIGGILGGANTIDAHHLYEFGKNIGIAFQLQDDILDVYGDSAKFGKQVGGDILSNKKTYLLLSALEIATGEILEELKGWIENKNFIAAEKVTAITAIYTKLSIRKLAESKMHEFHQKAMHHYHALSVDTEKKNMLLQFSESLLVREI
ncbi:MAG TPA: polyprenyl synthetase family protein, partial [Bacteroidia bacterium]|nr:polyprenyl synthetase family protein [Bacteroidia bacterium]